MPDYKSVYREHPDLYDELVLAEDADGCLLQAIETCCELPGARIVEAGAGTGRITRVLLEAGAAHVIATEIETAMLSHAEHALASYSTKLECIVADARSLPVDAGGADLAIAGWVFGHFRSWMADDWKREAGKAVSELERATRAGGTAIVVETLGTGAEEPEPAPELAEYYEWLESERGFVRQSIRTDYVFATVSEAARVTGFFFGDDFAAKVREHDWSRVPECTGVWSRKV